jgi:DNA ligase-1
MLAFDADINYYTKLLQANASLLCSMKLDGIRATVHNGRLMSRTLKPIPNKHIQQLLGKPELEGLDGELIVGAPRGEGVFARTSSGVMSHDGEPDFEYHVFDTTLYDLNRQPYSLRLRQVDAQIEGHPHIVPAWQRIVDTIEQLQDFEEDAIRFGYEGLIIRTLSAPYKFGRSTPREGGMGKLKRFSDSEATIVGFVELEHNKNEAVIDPRGLTTRASKQANKIGGGTLGALEVKDIRNQSWHFNIGTGFDSTLRQEIWEHPDRYMGKVVKYKFLPVGTLELPRHPVFLGFRDAVDL